MFFSNILFYNIFDSGVEKISTIDSWIEEYIKDPRCNVRFRSLWKKYSSASPDTSISEGLPLDINVNDHEIRSFDLTFTSSPEHVIIYLNGKTGSVFHENDFTKKILEDIDDAVVACDKNGVLVLFNQKAKELHMADVMPVQYDQWSNIYGLYYSDGVTPLETENVPLYRAFKGEIIKDVSFVIKNGDNVRHVISSGGPVLDHDGERAGAVIVMKDITEQRSYIKEIAKRERAYKELVETLPDVVIETDMKGNIIFMNDVLVQKGYVESKSELLNKNIFQFITNEGRDIAIRKFTDFLSENPGTMEYDIVFPNKRLVHCDVKGNPLFDNENHPRGIVFILRDLTRTKRIESQLRMLAHTIKSVSESISITDTSDRIIFVNDAFVKTYGYSEKELLGQKMDIVRSQFNDPATIANILPLTLNGGWEGELINKRKDGMEFPIHLSTSTVRDELGKIICLVGICKDITAQKAAEKELLENRQRFKKYFDNTTVGICVTSIEKGWIDVNHHLCQMLGYSKDELSGMNWAMLTHPDDLQRDVDLFNRVLSGEIDSYEIDKRFIRKDKTIVYTSLYAAAQRNSDGSLKHVLASLVDITSRKNAEEALRKNEKRFRDLANFLPVLIYETDLRGNLVFSNRTGFEWFGFKPEDLENGINIFDFVADPNHDLVRSRFLRIIEDKIVSSNEYILKRMDQSTFNALITSTVIENDGVIIGVRGVINDITDQKKAEELRVAHEAAQTLIQAQRHLSLLVDQSLVGFIEVTTDLIIKGWNPSAERIFGYKSEEAIGEYLPDLIIEPFNRVRIDENLHHVMNSKSGFRTINRNVTKDGRIIICEWHDTALIDTDGQVLSIASVVADITERVEAEEALTESREKLKQFAAHLQSAIEQERIQISRELHDSLGQTMTGLKIYCSRLRTKISASDSPEISNLISWLDEMIGIIDAVMQSIRKIAKKLRPRIIDEAGIVPAIESHLEEILTQAGISYTFDKQLDNISIKEEHKIEVFRIVQEVLTNVIRHSKATEVHISLKPSENWTILKMQDNGIGIPEVDILKLKTLGLMGMKERAATFGGELDIKGTAGAGTAITLKIPQV